MATLVRCREIDTKDLEHVLALLRRGFPERSEEQFSLVLARLTAHATPPGMPKYGYLLEADGDAVGVVLVIFSAIAEPKGVVIRGNVASWYVEPRYRSYAAMLTSRALAHKSVTYLNLTPAPHTWAILKAQGYKPLCNGQFASVPMLGPRVPDARVELVNGHRRLVPDLSPFENQLLHDHASYGCISVTCTAGDRTSPFVFSRRHWVRWNGVPFPFVLLAYCRELADFVRFAGPLGRFLTRHGVSLVFIDANDRIPGLVGKYLDWGPKFYYGSTPPRLGDVAYTERVMFGL